MTKVELLRRLVEITQMLINSGVCPESHRDFRSWFKMVLFAHQKGYLYVGTDPNTSHIDLVVIGYRVPEITTDCGKELPLEESGKILYVPMLASTSKDRTKLIKILRFYLKSNQDIERIAYRWRGSQLDLRSKRLRKRRIYNE